jgi:hypothetical protein
MSLHPADLDSDTLHELGTLHLAHDRAISALYRAGKARGAEMLTIALDREVQYHLDASDAILELIDTDSEP